MRQNLTVNFCAVAAAVEKDASSISPTILDYVVVDLNVVAALGCDNTWDERGSWKTGRSAAENTSEGYKLALEFLRPHSKCAACRLAHATRSQ